METVKEEDEQATNGGCPKQRIMSSVDDEKQEEALEIIAELVEKGYFLRTRNPAGLSPIYYPSYTSRFSRERKERMIEIQREDANEEVGLQKI